MSQLFQIHPDNPQKRLIQQAVDIIKQGGVIVYPTDCGYALGCHLGDKSALEKIKRLRQLDDKHNFTLVCRDLSTIGTYAKVNNQIYRLLKAHTPGAYTFILKATTEVPRRLLHPKRRTIGIRIPDSKIVDALLDVLGEPIMSTSLIMPGETEPLTDPYDIRDLLQHNIDAIIDGGYCGMEATTVINLIEDEPEIVREGAGDVAFFK
ncbi:L-threonylcarbamoyladenylate synthase [Neptunomonas phycophila]|jgi:tRNA threonylcarbamoyl adenosine modification protein (Sua5/YciO/YrdC/YwlC family)|uniref:L-threonylcarbamoyladenylate synthase n=1 Tax=Neptunomonas phycophila TaxID=1572645 RepID=A0AAW7XLW9_9GAMM|nr:L-threonylcarbamoyladenylate synthase [Neptunomonas phycophila]MDO6454383.1 L-threonylcarbamoyladenylate synthase [Neptunomonas phycophila]MDO6467237.1 L-threonylcarbamoyladenylate synthase [Neptunomonas phycophila]MDO6782649.1 L-threonylcarbamoyladenylate synthase [Neptunomonas phycophila]MDP2522012.1 L-threonylcarbamoyladenylate synthase [Neptunomonas phycophila]QLE96923.1 threonylcarbamoyl-AMP synthase [Neptunomonas phycophila]